MELTAEFKDFYKELTDGSLSEDVKNKIVDDIKSQSESNNYTFNSLEDKELRMKYLAIAIDTLDLNEVNKKYLSENFLEEIKALKGLNSGDKEKDAKMIRSFYEKIQAKYPENFNQA